jgi:hypothetical protein
MMLTQVWTPYPTNWFFIEFPTTNINQSSIFPTSQVKKLKNHFHKIFVIEHFPTIPKVCLKFFYLFLVMILLSFSWKILLKIQCFLHLESKKLKITSTKPYSLNISQQYQKFVANCLFIYSSDFIEFSMVNLFNMQQLLHCRYKHDKIILMHKGLSSDTKSTMSGTMAWEIFMWNKTNKLFSLK